MDIFLTFDYEIYFGSPHGSVEKCILEPTDLLRKIATEEKIKMVFFIDVGHLVQLERFALQYPNLQVEYDAIVSQIKTLVKEGHDCQLHIHPHWEKTTFDGNKWVFDHNYYKLVDFSDEEILSIFENYHLKLISITGKPSKSFRAGGWCLQPFERIKPAFELHGIKIDSSVFVGGKAENQVYSYDFTTAPKKDAWRFQSNLCQEDSEGNFLEIPISDYTYSPIFFWKLFILGRLFPKKHKSIGNGKSIQISGGKRKVLTQPSRLPASVEGFFATKMESVIRQNEKKGFEKTVFIGHPKAMTYYSLKKLQQKIKKLKRNHRFVRFSDV